MSGMNPEGRDGVGSFLKRAAETAASRLKGRGKEEPQPKKSWEEQRKETHKATLARRDQERGAFAVEVSRNPQAAWVDRPITTDVTT